MLAVGMHMCTHVHNNKSCTLLQNYMLVYTNMAARQNSDRIYYSTQQSIFLLFASYGKIK